MAKFKNLRLLAGARRTLRRHAPAIKAGARVLSAAAALSPRLRGPARLLAVGLHLGSAVVGKGASRKKGRRLTTKRKGRGGGSVPRASAGGGGSQATAGGGGGQGAVPANADAAAPSQPTRQAPPATTGLPLLSDEERKQLRKQFGAEGAAEIERRLQEQEEEASDSSSAPAKREVPGAPTVGDSATGAAGDRDRPSGSLPGSSGEGDGEGDTLPEVLDRLSDAVEKLTAAAEKLAQAGKGERGGKGGGGQPRGQGDAAMESAKGLGGQLAGIGEVVELLGALL